MLVMVVVKCLFGHSAVLVILRICHPDGTEGSLSLLFLVASLRFGMQILAEVTDNDNFQHYFILRR